MKTLIAGLILSLTVVSTSFGADMGEIKCGETKSGEILVPDQEDRWTFTGQAGDGVVIAASRTSGFIDPDIRLYGPSGGIHEAAHDNFLEHQLKETGAPMRRRDIQSGQRMDGA